MWLSTILTLELNFEKKIITYKLPYFASSHYVVQIDLSLRVKYHARHLTNTYIMCICAWNALAHYNNIIIIIYNIYNIMYNEVA